jgi:thiosulfate/3-mercaptopyruvate sulfurtransferase
MVGDQKPRSMKIVLSAALFGLFATGIVCVLLGASRPAAGHSAAAQNTPRARPAPSSPPERPTPQTLQPADLVKELTSSSKPTVVCISSRALYEGAHVPGASFHGDASTSGGLKDLRKWAQDVPRSSNVVLYCGCCPVAQCPNLRPALMALRQMGFTRVRVLRFQTDFNSDWIAKGYPVEKGK